jgi:hypothetical protein
MNVEIHKAEMVLPPVRWVTRTVPMRVGPQQTVTVLQQEWLVEEYGNSEKLGRPMQTRREWRDVPVVQI